MQQTVEWSELSVKRALVVDDDGSMRSALGQVLERLLGYVVTLAGDGEDAVSLLDGEGASFDVVVSDVLMPGMGGEALVQLMAERWPGIPVVLVSGEPFPRRLELLVREPEPATLCGSRQRVAWLPKPFTYRQLAGVLQDVSPAGQDRPPPGGRPGPGAS